MITLEAQSSTLVAYLRAFRNFYGFKSPPSSPFRIVMNFWEHVLETLSPADAEQEAWLQSVIDTLETVGIFDLRPRLPRQLAAYFDELAEALELFEEIHGSKFSACTTRRDEAELSKLRLLRDQCRGLNLGVAY